MKRHIILFALSLVLCGCSSEQLGELQGRLTQKYFASFDNQSTKVFVDDQIHLRWNENDCISIFNSTYNAEYKFDGNTGDDNGTFSPVNESYNTGNDIPSTYAVFPYLQNTAISTEGVISFEFPRVQRYEENSFGNSSNTMVAVTENKTSKSLYFKNICGYVIVQLYGEGQVKHITIKGNNEERISGAATISASYGSEPTILMKGNEPDANSRIITLDCGDGVSLGSTPETATPFWICIPPTAFSKGFTITVTDTEGRSMVKKITDSREVKRNIINHITPDETSFETNDIIISCADFNKLETEDDNTYLLTGQVSGNIELAYGYFDIMDDTGAAYVYGCTNWSEYNNIINGGDIVSVRGKFYNYNGKKELKDAYIVSLTPNEPQRPTIITDVSLTDFLKLPDNSDKWYRISGLKCISASVSAYATVKFTDGSNTIDMFAPDNYNKIDFQKYGVTYSIVGHKSTYKGDVQMSGGYIESQNEETDAKIYLSFYSQTKASISNQGINFEEGDIIHVNGKEYSISKDSNGFYVTVSRAQIYLMFYPGRAVSSYSYADYIYTLNVAYGLDDSFIGQPYYYGMIVDEPNDMHSTMMPACSIIEMSFDNPRNEIYCSLTFSNTFSAMWNLYFDYYSGRIMDNCEPISDKSNSVTFKLKEDQRTYYIPVPPGVSTNGIQVDIKESNGSIIVHKALGNSITFQIGSYYSFGTINIQNDVLDADYVDLGLSVLWASSNLGANVPEGAGDYYAWGETSTKSSYSWENYKWCNGTSSSFTKYCSSSSYGIVDNLTNLTSDDDVAAVKLQDGWRIPTLDNILELINNTNKEKVYLNGVCGYKYTSTKPGYESKWIFIPAAGEYSGNELLHVGLSSSIWSSTVWNSGLRAYCLHGGSTLAENRCLGFNVRPVKDAGNKYHPFTFAFGKLPTHDEAGWKDYLFCAECGKYYYENGGQVIEIGNETDFAAWKSQTDLGYLPPISNIEYVDLGLSVLWATCNIGASHPTEVGAYVSWAETERKKEEDAGWESYKYANHQDDTFTKYNTVSEWGHVDGKTRLEPEDDLVSVVYGGNWRTPTADEWNELINECNWEWTDDYYGCAGFLVTSRKSGYTGKSIFLPYTEEYFSYSSGIRTHESYYCYYWTSEISSKDPFCAYYLSGGKSGKPKVTTDTGYGRLWIYPVRGVSSK